MKTRLTLIVVIAFAAIAAGTAERSRRAADEAAVRAVVQRYFDGMMAGDPAILREAFDANAYLIGPGHGQPTRIAFEEWAAEWDGPLPDPERRRNAIVSVDVAGHAASAKTRLDWPGIVYVDYLSLLRIDGRWRIVNKIWHQEPSADQIAALDETPIDAAALEAYAGTYHTGERTFDVWIEDGRLRLASHGRSPTALYHKGGHAFAPSFDPEARVDFTVEGGRATGFAFGRDVQRVVATRAN